MQRVVGIKIDTKSPHTKDKIYYYKTNEDLKRGDVINVKVESGGAPTATVVIENSQKKFSRQLKDLETKNWIIGKSFKGRKKIWINKYIDSDHLVIILTTFLFKYFLKF